MEKMECPVCGKIFDAEFMDYLENGNVACSNCVEKEEIQGKSHISITEDR